MKLRSALAPGVSIDEAFPPWRTLADGGGAVDRRPPPTMRRAIGGFLLASALALCCSVAIGFVVAGQAAQREAVREALAATKLLARSVITPALEDELLERDPAAIARLDAVVKRFVLTDNRVRIKLWTAGGRILYSDEPRLIGDRIPLDDAKMRVVRGGEPLAHLATLEGPDYKFERAERQLLEVYQHVDLPNGTDLLFETYSRYAQVTERREEVLRAFAPITIGTVLLLQLFQLPLVWNLVRRIRAAHLSSERSLQKAIDSSTVERRRIAGNLHDGIVQGLVGASFVISGAVEAVERGRPTVADQLRDAAAGIRESIRGLRSMLVEIYPPIVSEAGLPAVLDDLVAPLRSQGIETHVVTPDQVHLPRSVEALVFRISQEVVRNVAQHSGAQSVTLTLDVLHDVVRLEIVDDGIGLDIDQSLARRDGHVGMQILRELAL